MQGASAAVVYVVGLSVVIDTMDSSIVGEYMGYVSLAMSLGALLGPIFGGVVYEAGGYFAVFGIAFGVIGLDVCFRLAMIEKKTAAKWLDSNVDVVEEALSSNPFVNCLAIDSQQVEPKAETLDEDQSSTSRTFNSQSSTENAFRTPAIFILLKSRRMLFTLWAPMVLILIVAAFDSEYFYGYLRALY